MSFPLYFWLVAISYLIAANFYSYPLDYLHKALPALLLAVWLSTSRQSFMLVVAFLFCALGDLLLAITIEYNFIFGLAAFTIAQVFFAFSFWQWRNWSPWKITPVAFLLLLVLVIGSVIIPSSGGLAIPVTAYMSVIFCMVLAALYATKTDYVLLLGALMFMVSDSLIGINKFVMTLPYEHLAIMSSYYIALYLLATGILTRTQSDPSS